MKTFAFYPGCKISFEMPELEVSVLDSLKKLNFNLKYLSGFSCCPSFDSVMSFDRLTSFALTVRNLSVAEDENLDILTPCDECYSVFKYTISSLKDENTFIDVNSILSKIGRVYRGKSEVYHILELYYQRIVDGKVRVKRLDIKAGIHPGCLLLYADKDRDFLEMAKKLMGKLGIKLEDYSRMDYYCGRGPLRILNPEESYKFSEKILDSFIHETDAETLITFSPHCHEQLKKALRMLAIKNEKLSKIRILFISEIIQKALDMGDENG